MSAPPKEILCLRKPDQGVRLRNYDLRGLEKKTLVRDQGHFC
jgi:hypothetical protein